MNPSQRFTRKEREILSLLAEGLSNKEIADRLVVSVETIKWYNSQIYRKLGVSTRDEAVDRFAEISAAVPAETASSPRVKLPTLTTPVIGRNHDIAALRRLILDDNSRVLTLTGPPGIGKTRLVIETASTLANHFSDGVVFVPLAALNDPAQVAGKIASELDLLHNGEPTAEAVLKAHLSAQQFLLVLDNMEHLLSAALMVSDLLAAAPALKVITTSREALGIYGEREYIVAPLHIPERSAAPAFAVLANSSAVTLFAQRARAVKPDFMLTPANIDDVAEICRRLDGLPLAIELAAARVKLYSPHVLLARLSESMALLSGGAKDLPSRHQTLPAAIDWSYQLLSTGRQQLFRRLGVFAGGWSLDSFEAVRTPDLVDDPYDGLESLLSKSLVHRTDSMDGEPRFTLLETIRAYALEKLAQSSEETNIRDAHAKHFLLWAEQVRPELHGIDQIRWIKVMEDESSNLRAALDWLLIRDIPAAERLAAALEYFWWLTGNFNERRHAFEALQPYLERLPLPAQARVLRMAGNIARDSGDLALAQDRLNQSLALHKQLQDGREMGITLWYLGWAQTLTERVHEACSILEESVVLLRQYGSSNELAAALNSLGKAHNILGDHRAAQAYLEQARLLYEAVGDLRGIASAKANLGSIAIAQGDWMSAETLFEEGLLIARKLNARFYVATLLRNFAVVVMLKGDWERANLMMDESCRLLRMTAHPMLAQNLQILAITKTRVGDYEQARQLQLESLDLMRSSTESHALTFEIFADVAAAQGHWVLAAVLFGASERIAARQETPPRPRTAVEEQLYKEVLAEVRAHLSKADFDAAWARGREMSREAAFAYWHTETEAH